jgi:uncharacterized radical SAM superfamily Fe-S cluster-containing enzyme
MVTERATRPYTFFKMTQSTCPVCIEIVQAQVVFEKNKVYFLKFCPKHGHSKALVSEDAEYYQNAYSFIRPGSIPNTFQTEVKDGCPKDCGMCPDHQQHTCLPIIEITDYCNLECPVCIVDNHDSVNISQEDYKGIIDRLIISEGTLDTITLSGGEPTGHPEFLKLLDISDRPEIKRISIVTNGIRIARSKEFCAELKKRNVYVILQFDGFDNDVYLKIRGAKLLDEKYKALDNLAEFNISTQIAFVPAKGVNDHQLGEAVQMLLARDHVLSLLIQPFAQSGQGGGVFPTDPLDRLTIPGVINAIEKQTDGLVCKSDFIPLPCAHPLCVSLTYLLRLNDGNYLPFPRFVDFRKHLDLFEQTATLDAGIKTEMALKQAINHLWSAAGEIPDSEIIMTSLKRVLLEMYPSGNVDKKELLKISERQAKTIFIHHYMDRHDFDVERLMKCCHHYPQIDGRIMPACGFNMFHRGAVKGPNSPVSDFGKGPFIK